MKGCALVCSVILDAIIKYDFERKRPNCSTSKSFPIMAEAVFVRNWKMQLYCEIAFIIRMCSVKNAENVNKNRNEGIEWVQWNPRWFQFCSIVKKIQSAPRSCVVYSDRRNSSECQQQWVETLPNDNYAERFFFQFFRTIFSSSLLPNVNIDKYDIEWIELLNETVRKCFVLVRLQDRFDEQLWAFVLVQGIVSALVVFVLIFLRYLGHQVVLPSMVLPSDSLIWYKYLQI